MKIRSLLEGFTEQSAKGHAPLMARKAKSLSIGLAGFIKQVEDLDPYQRDHMPLEYSIMKDEAEKLLSSIRFYLKTYQLKQ